jgi:hypothetical protein
MFTPIACAAVFTFRYKDDILSLDNYSDRIYAIKPEIKDTTDTDRSASYLDLHLEIDSEGRLRTKIITRNIKSISKFKVEIKNL